MERTPNAGQRDIPSVIRHIFRPARAKRRGRDTTGERRSGILAELDRYPELRH